MGEEHEGNEKDDLISSSNRNLIQLSNAAIIFGIFILFDYFSLSLELVFINL